MDGITLRRLNEVEELLPRFRAECKSQIEEVASEISNIFHSGKKLLICGNGGSAADAQHFAAEFMSSFMLKLDRRSLPAIALTTDSSILSAIGNDFGYEYVFSRQIEGLGLPGDGLLAISTSGTSSNCLKAASIARSMNLRILSLTRKGSVLSDMSDRSVRVPSENTQHIQECHVIAYHIITELVENKFKEENK